jgi:hypothetical protein
VDNAEKQSNAAMRIGVNLEWGERVPGITFKGGLDQ